MKSDKLHGSTLLTDESPSLVSSVTGGPVPVYWGKIPCSAGGSKAVAGSGGDKSCLQPWQPLSGIFAGQRPFPSLFEIENTISLGIFLVKPGFAAIPLPS